MSTDDTKPTELLTPVMNPNSAEREEMEHRVLEGLFLRDWKYILRPQVVIVMIISSDGNPPIKADFQAVEFCLKPCTDPGTVYTLDTDVYAIGFPREPTANEREQIVDMFPSQKERGHIRWVTRHEFEQGETLNQYK